MSEKRQHMFEKKLQHMSEKIYSTRLKKLQHMSEKKITAHV